MKLWPHVYHLIHMSLNSAIHQKNHQSGISFSKSGKCYPRLDKSLGLPNTYLLDGDLCGGIKHKPTFEQPGPDNVEQVSCPQGNNKIWRLKHDIPSWVVNESDSLTTRHKRLNKTFDKLCFHSNFFFIWTYQNRKKQINPIVTANWQRSMA